MTVADWTVPYANLGVLLVKDANDPAGQAIGDCPFCSRENHFFVSQATGLWDCKVCLEQGNLTTFLTRFVEQGELQTSIKDYAVLEDLKGLPRSVLKRFSVCLHPLNPNLWLLPAKSTTGSTVNVYTYSPDDNRIFATKGLSHSLTGMEFWRKDRGGHVYICEGQWDTYATADLFDALDDDAEAVVVGVPGAGTFPAAWAPLFAGKHVHFLYDNDETGRRGMARAAATLFACPVKPLSVSKIDWPRNSPEGCDMRDLYLDPDAYASLLPPRRPVRR